MNPSLYFTHSTFSLFHGRCVCCAEPARTRLFETAHALLCIPCIEKLFSEPFHISGTTSSPYQNIFIYSVYKGTLQNIIPDYKYSAKLYYAPLFADLLAITYTLLISQEYDYCLPVPQHYIKTRSRGFYHLGIIAKYFSRYTGIPSPSNYISTRYNYPSQQGKSRSERLARLHTAFAVHSPLDGARILLLDDVITTGATLYALAEHLIDAGASTVDCIALAINKRGMYL